MYHDRLVTAVYMTKDGACLADSVLPPILQAFSQHLSLDSHSREWQSGQSSFVASEHHRDIPIWATRVPCGQCELLKVAELGQNFAAFFSRLFSCDTLSLCAYHIIAEQSENKCSKSNA